MSDEAQIGEKNVSSGDDPEAQAWNVKKTFVASNQYCPVFKGVGGNPEIVDRDRATCLFECVLYSFPVPGVGNGKFFSIACKILQVFR